MEKILMKEKEYIIHLNTKEKSCHSKFCHENSVRQNFNKIKNITLIYSSHDNIS